MVLSLAQQTALAVVPKITASLSVLSSSAIAVIVLRDKSRRSKVFHRLVLGLSLTDVVTSSWWVASTWPIPRDSGVLWASGNTKTCTVQGFFLQLGIANPLYNSSLSVYYLLAIHYSYSETRFRFVEPLFHLGPLGWGFVTAIIGIPLKIFNNAGLWCWIADYQGRNTNTSPYRWGIFYAPLWLSFVAVSVILTKIVVYFRKKTRTSEKFLCLHPAVVQASNDNHSVDNDNGDDTSSDSVDNYSTRRCTGMSIYDTDDDGEDDKRNDDDEDAVFTYSNEYAESQPVPRSCKMLFQFNEDSDGDSSSSGNDDHNDDVVDAQSQPTPPRNLSGRVNDVENNQIENDEGPENTDQSGPVSILRAQSTGRKDQPNNEPENGVISRPVDIITAPNTFTNSINRSTCYNSDEGNNSNMMKHRRSSRWLVIDTKKFANQRRQLAFQCLRYALVFYVTWFPITLLRILQAIGKPIEFPLLFAAAFLTPLQGLPNFFVYLYPLILKHVRNKYGGHCRSNSICNNIAMVVPAGGGSPGNPFSNDHNNNDPNSRRQHPEFYENNLPISVDSNSMVSQITA